MLLRASRSVYKALFKVSFAIILRIGLTLNKLVEKAQTVLVGTAELERLLHVLDEDPDLGLIVTTAMQSLDDHPTRKGDKRARAPCPVWIRVRRVERLSLREEPQGRVDRDHLVVVGEVGVDGTV